MKYFLLLFSIFVCNFVYGQNVTSDKSAIPLAELEGLTITAYVKPPLPELGYSKNDKVTIIPAKEAELLNIEKQWSLIKSDSMSSWVKVIYENLNYPETMWKNGVQGKVFTKFRIDANGDLVDWEILRGIAPDIDNEVLRVLKLMPNWSEYYEGGRRFIQIVSAQEKSEKGYFGVFLLPITFEIKYIENLKK